MSKMLDAVLGRRFTTKKLESLLGNARDQLNNSLPEFQNIISGATSNVTDLLNRGNHKKAYRIVDIVIKNQNDFDVCTLIIGYLDLLIAGVHLFKPNRDIPQELLEAVSSCLFAAPSIRLWCTCTCNEIQDVRNFLLSHFGQNLAAQYLELRDNCGINLQIIDKLSKEPLLEEVRMKVLQEIAAKENIVLKLEDASTSTEGTSDVSKAKLASEERVEDEIREGCGLSHPAKRGKKKQTDMADAEKLVGNSSNGPENKKSEQEEKGNDDGLAKREKKKKIDVAGKAVGSSSNGPENKESGEEPDGNDDGLAKRGNKKKLNVAGKAVGSSSNGPENKEPGQGQEGNDDRLAKRGKKKRTDVAGKAVESSSNSLKNKEAGQEREGNDDGSAKRRMKKKINVTGKAVGSSSNGPENKESEQEQEGNDDVPAKRGKKKHTDVAEKAVGSSSTGPENKESKQEREGNDDVPAKKGMKKQIDVSGKAVGSSHNDPENKDLGEEQEGNGDDLSDGEGDVRSESTRSLSESGISIKLDEGTVELLEKDVDINWNAEETGHVDHMVHSVEDTTGLKGPFSVRTRRFRKQ